MAESASITASRQKAESIRCRLTDHFWAIYAVHRTDSEVGRRKRSGITLIQKNDLITFNLAHYGADVQRGENAMRLWRKNLLMVGFVFVAAAVITAVVFSQFDILNYTAEGVIRLYWKSLRLFALLSLPLLDRIRKIGFQEPWRRL